jgi:transcriptional regulator with XRE-family HTH domain
MSRLLLSYLKPLRLQRGLSQLELAQLMGISVSLLSKVESQTRRPTARVILPAEIVFGLPAREIFPGAYNEIEKEVGHRARSLRAQVKHRSDPASGEKRALLKTMVKRLGASNRNS